MYSHNTRKCPTCNRPSNIRKERISSIHMSAVIKARDYCEASGKKEFEISDLDLTNSEYTSFSILVYFGLLYKKSHFKRGTYGMPAQRVNEFLEGRCTIADHILFDPITGTRQMSNKRIKVHQIPHINELLDSKKNLIT